MTKFTTEFTSWGKMTERAIDETMNTNSVPKNAANQKMCRRRVLSRDLKALTARRSAPGTTAPMAPSTVLFLRQSRELERDLKGHSNLCWMKCELVMGRVDAVFYSLDLNILTSKVSERSSSPK